MADVAAWPTVCVVPMEELTRNLVSALRRDLPILAIGPPLPYSIAVVGGGPSVQDDLPVLRKWDGFIVAINGAHDWLLDNGIVPDAMLVMDPQPCVVDYLKRATETTTYLVASCCDPSVFDLLADKQVVLWHVMHGDHIPVGANYCVTGGPTAASRAPHVMHMWGARDIHLFGVDSSFSLGTHAYALHKGVGQQIAVRVRDRVFITDKGLTLQAEYIWKAVKHAPADTKITVHGSGLCRAIVENGGEYEVIE